VSGAVARLAPAAPVAAEERDSTLVRLVAFTGLAAFGVGHWWGMAAGAPSGRAVAVVAVAAGGGALLSLIPRLALPRTAEGVLAAAVTFLMLCAGLAAAGLSLKLLLPGNWSELSDGLDRGLSGIRTIDWPYDGPDAWVRFTILLGAPLLLTAASALAFWPVRRYQSFWRAEALIALLLLYGVAVTNHEPGSPLTRGFVLLLLVAAWLWLPRLGRRDALVASVATLTAGVVSLPVAASLDGDQPWWDYRSFDWFGGGKSVVYDWNHRYGPIDWPRDGTTLMNVKSSQPLYWKTEVLDQFDGVRWLRVRQGSPRALAGLPDRFRRSGRSWDYFEYNPRWDRHVRVTVRSLRSDLVIGPGTIYQVSGAGATVSADDGTTFKLDEPLEKGDSYTVSAYAPKPNARQMRGAPTEFPAEVSRYTEIELPGQGAVEIPLRGDSFSGTPGAARGVARSEYGEVYRLARRLTAGAPTLYDAVARIQRHLRSRYTYDENPPRRSLPLAAFLLRDRVGYCQQFSGAMALMLRMVGIPTRVAAGFTPGSYNSDSGEFRVRDLDAHSWVEVFITGIGWVSFDPTPPAAPAETQSSGLETLANGGRDAGDVTSSRGDGATSEATGGSAAGGGGGEATLGWWVLPLGLGALLLAAGGWVAFLRLRRRRPSDPAEAAEAQLRELESALPRLGWRLPGGSTLSGVESRLAPVAGPAAASYAARLRAHRYEARPPDPPDRTARRDLRRALAAAAGKNGRLRALVAIPPGGPFRRL
jgi:transglutaminase-like putative cysteine protease